MELKICTKKLSQAFKKILEARIFKMTIQLGRTRPIEQIQYPGRKDGGGVAGHIHKFWAPKHQQQQQQSQSFVKSKTPQPTATKSTIITSTKNQQQQGVGLGH